VLDYLGQVRRSRSQVIFQGHKRRNGAKVVGATSSDGFVTKYRGILEHRYLDIRSDGISLSADISCYRAALEWNTEQRDWRVAGIGLDHKVRLAEASSYQTTGTKPGPLLLRPRTCTLQLRP